MTSFLLLLFGAYLLGAVPFGLIVARVLGGPDPRTAGSGNLGAANLYRLLGPKAGLFTLAGDVAKGAAPVLAAWLWLIPAGPWQEAGIAAVGAAPVLGHIFPPFFKFRGGKGVATSFGVVAVISPWALLNLLIVHGGVLARTRIFSVSSLVYAWLLPVAVGLFTEAKPYLLLAGVLSGLILYRHLENLRRLALGQEPTLDGG